MSNCHQRSLRFVACAFALALGEFAQAAVFTFVEPRTGLVVLSNTRGASAQAFPVPAQVPLSRRKDLIGADQFPRVSASRQKDLDADRRAILLAELKAEQHGLQLATIGRASTDVLKRHVENIAALQRELQDKR